MPDPPSTGCRVASFRGSTASKIIIFRTKFSGRVKNQISKVHRSVDKEALDFAPLTTTPAETTTTSPSPPTTSPVTTTTTTSPVATTTTTTSQVTARIKIRQILEKKRRRQRFVCFNFFLNTIFDRYNICLLDE